jgi:hypothetical protein
VAVAIPQYLLRFPIWHAPFVATKGTLVLPMFTIFSGPWLGV